MSSSSSPLNSLNTRQHVVSQANVLVERYNIPVPRFLSSRFIDYHFWCHIFTRVFHIKADNSLKKFEEQKRVLKGCLTTLETLIDASLDHITADKLMAYDGMAIRNLLELAHSWPRPSGLNGKLDENLNFVDNVDGQNGQQHSLESELSSRLESLNVNQDLASESDQLACRLYQALKTQLLARELEKKIKEYLGDVTVTRSESIRASRQSIVRTRSIQPLTIPFVSSTPSTNFAFSVDLKRWFPEISSPLLEQIRMEERKLLLIECKINDLNRGHLSERLPHSLVDMVKHQRNQAESLASQKATPKKPKDRQTVQRISKRQERTHRAYVRNEIKDFSKQATAAYLNSRSYLEMILAHEIHKVDVARKMYINEIRKCLRSDDADKLADDRVRLLLETIDKLLYER